ncbi:MAG: LysR family transcriptional regulator [Hyphomicrobiales bacterium]|nr:LysR family transcriptional regulator [Hyphomicrobiales bacterium]
MNWNDVRYILAVARTGTLSAAARETGVNQTTVARRVEAAERELGVRLFDRRDGRLRATTLGESAIARARRVEEEVLALENVVADHDAELSGVVRVATVEGLLMAVLVPGLPGFQAAQPRISLEFVAGMGNLDLARRQADIALRLARPERGDITVRKLADVGFAVYGAAGPEAQRPLHQEPWITYNEEAAHLPESQWVLRSFRSVRPALRTNSVPAIAAALRAGVGVGVLPCYVGDTDPGLRRRSGPYPVVVREAWMLIPSELRATARVRAVADWLIAITDAARNTLLGRGRTGPGAEA